MFRVFKSPLLYVFLLSFLYWMYLLASSQMIIRYDSLGYEALGTLITEKGWSEYFRGGPTREPLYPFLISLSMKMSTFLPYSYYKIQTFIQLMILGLSQSLVFLIMQRHRVRGWIISLILLYMAFSPAIINSAFSLYSEILTFPFILGILLCAAHSFRKLEDAKARHIIFYALLLGVLFTGVTLVKGIYEYIFYFVLFFFFFIFLRALIFKKKKICLNSLRFLIVLALSFYLPIRGYKELNRQYNGIFTLADNRADFSLYSSAARRTEPLTGRQWLAGIAYTAGEGACQRFFQAEECYFWGIQNYDGYGLSMLSKVAQSVPKEQVSPVMKKLALHKALDRPFQFAFLAGLECIKMFFWESTKIGFVEYPGWLMRLYDWRPFKDTLRLVISLASLLAFIYLWVYILRKRIHLLDPSNKRSSSSEVVWFILLIASLHIGLYALFMTIPRFALPITPLYLLMMAFAAERILSPVKNQ